MGHRKADYESAERYYIGGKQYVATDKNKLCTYRKQQEPGDFFSGTVESLYVTGKGAYFKTVSGTDETAVSLLTEEQARNFMDCHPAGINLELYDSIFGEPPEA